MQMQLRRFNGVPRPSPPSSCRRLTARHAIKAGDMLPSFELLTDDMSTIKSEDMISDSGAIIFIYPKANTSGCTTQACGFNDNREVITYAGFKIFGLSADKPEDQASWKAAQGYDYPLLCDPEFKVIPLLTGSEPGGKIIRSHVIVARGGKVMNSRIGIKSDESAPEALKYVEGFFDGWMAGWQDGWESSKVDITDSESVFGSD